MSNPCPLITRPGQIIGFVNGRPVRTIAGGSAPAGDAGAAAGQQDGGQAAASGADAGQQAQGGAQGGNANGASQGGAQTASSGAQSAADALAGWDGKVESLPESVQKIIRDAREDAGKARTNAKQQAAEEARQQMAQEIGKALGLIKNDEAADPAKLAQQVEAAQTAAREASVQLAVHQKAAAHQGDPNALLDSNSFLAKVKNLDPTAADFAAKVDAAIKEAVTANPKLKAGQAPGASSVDLSGRTGERRSDKPKSLADAVSDHYGT
jgi:hypothetical protein